MSLLHDVPFLRTRLPTLLSAILLTLLSTRLLTLLSTLLLAFVLGGSSGCGSGGGEADTSCDGTCTQQSLLALDVEIALTQAVAEAERLGVAATISITDRVGNVLVVFSMTGAAANTVIDSARGVSGGLENLVVPSALAAITKAATASYLSSQGNAFTTRTASQIVQEHFNPGESGRPAGPLFGVQFSQLPCGDLVQPFVSGQQLGPKAVPLGLSADPGGIPLYKEASIGSLTGAAVVGGVGVEIGCTALDACAACSSTGASCAAADGDCNSEVEHSYGFDPLVTDFDRHLEERIAIAAVAGFEAPVDRRANRIFVDGKTLRYADDEGAGAATTADCVDLGGTFVPLFTDTTSCATITAGVRHGSAASGVLETTFGELRAELLVDASGFDRYPPIDGSDLSASEVRAILTNALEIAELTRAQIRRPLGTPARVSISVVDVDGTVLGLVRSPDAPVFGIDVSLQKARTAAFFSSTVAADRLGNAAFTDASPDMAVRVYLDRARVFLSTRALFAGAPISAADVLTGDIAFSDRAGGNLSRPFFPDGIDGNASGPFSHDFDDWSPFSTGLQLDLVATGVLEALGCLGSSVTAAGSCSAVAELPNGIQIFPGSVPIYRDRVLVGGLGISGDGVDQDDLIAFLGLHNAGIETGTGIGNAPVDMRADNLSVDGSNLRFVSCPVKPFIATDTHEACDGL